MKRGRKSGNFTPRQREVLDFIKSQIRQGTTPTIREITSGCNVTLHAIVCILDRLEKQGRITRQPRVSRGIKVTRLWSDPPPIVELTLPVAKRLLDSVRVNNGISFASHCEDLPALKSAIKTAESQRSTEPVTRNLQP